MNLFEIVKYGVSCREAAELYGVEGNHYGMALCPFHNDRHPSLYVADDILNGNSKMIIRFDDNDVSVTDWYDLTTTNAEQIRFYKNGRIDVRFKDSAAAGNCFKRLRLDEITQREN